MAKRENRRAGGDGSCQAGDNLIIHAAVEVCKAGDVLVVTTTSESTDGMFGRIAGFVLRARGVGDSVRLQLFCK